MEPHARVTKRALSKCEFCRSQRKKCSPTTRIWPGQKCHACDKRDLPCGPNVYGRPCTYSKTGPNGAVPRGATRRTAVALHPPQTHSLTSNTSTPSRAGERSDTVFSVPFHQDPDFIGRTAVLEELTKTFTSQESHRRAALVGLAGVGKSQIAIEFAQRLRNSGFKWIIWLSAVNSCRFEQCCLDALSRLDISPHDDKLTWGWPTLRKELEAERSGRWILIVDGVERNVLDRGPAHEQTCKQDHKYRLDLLDQLPRSSFGSVLLTTRSRALAFQLSGECNPKLNIPCMDETDALQLLRRKIPADPTDDSECLTLLDFLGHLPLAITQTAAHAVIRNTRVSKLIERLASFELVTAALLDDDVKDLRREPDACNSALENFEAIFEQIRDESYFAIEVLSMLAAFGKQKIPRSVFQSDPRKDSIDQALNTLVVFSIIDSDPESDAISLHCLVRVATQRWLGPFQTVQGTQAAVRLLIAEFPAGACVSSSPSRILAPHVHEILNNDWFSKLETLQQASLCFRMGHFAASEGKLDIAQNTIAKGDCAVACMSWNEIQDVGSILHECRRLKAITLAKIGNYTMANIVRVSNLPVDPQETMYGSISSLQDRTILAVLHMCQGNHKEAQSITEVDDIIAETSGMSDHAVMLAVREAYAAVTAMSCDFERAEKLYRYVHDRRLSVFGAEHPSTLNSQSVLAGLMYSKGSLSRPWQIQEEAIAMQHSILTNQTNVLGPRHPSTLLSRSLVATMSYSHYSRIGDQVMLEEALQIQIGALQILTMSLGEEHPYTLANMVNKATMLFRHRRHGEAIDLQERTVAIQQRVMGQLDPQTSLSQQRLASMRFFYENPGLYKEQQQNRLDLLPLVSMCQPESLGVAWYNVLTL